MTIEMEPYNSPSVLFPVQSLSELGDIVQILPQAS